MTSWKTRREIAALREANNRSIELRYGKFDNEFRKIYPTFDNRTFLKRLIGGIVILMIYRYNINGLIYKDSSIIANTIHSKVVSEDISRKYNIGLQKSKDTIETSTQHVVFNAIHPLTMWLCDNILNLHRPRL